jgi:phosphatidylserine decarboxylase
MIRVVRSLLQNEDLNFLLTNRIPRIALTRFMGWFSRIENPWLVFLSIKTWQIFTPLDFSDAKKSRFTSLQDCFTRELKPGARPIDRDARTLVSPCDAYVGAHGRVTQGALFQAKGFSYRLADLIPDAGVAGGAEGCEYVTLRLSSSMYHRFHAPDDCRIRKVTYISGDTWNVNPIALRRIESLFCKNERVVIEALRDGAGDGAGDGARDFILVPVAAVLVASIRLHCIDALLRRGYAGPRRMPCDFPARRGDELGWFEHGSTIIFFAPRGYTLLPGWKLGDRIRVGQGLFHAPAPATGAGAPAVG